MEREPPPLFEDTAPEMVERYFEHLRRMTPSQSFRRFSNLVDGVHALARAGLRSRHPQADDREIEIRLATILYGREAASRIGAVPEDAVELPPMGRP